MENLYFIAIIPPDPIAGEVTAFKQDFANRFQSEGALRVMPHITLKNPFHLDIKRHEVLLKWFEKMYVPVSPFVLYLKDFGSFPKLESPVIFVKPMPSEPLKILQKEMIRSFHRRFPEVSIEMDRRFTPHMTVAYRDLSLEHYQEAWKEYQAKAYSASGVAGEIFLLQHDTRQWNVVGSHKLQATHGMTLQIDF